MAARQGSGKGVKTLGLFLLIPRFSAHYLIGDIAEDLHEWMRQICVSFEWRLESILIRPVAHTTTGADTGIIVAEVHDSLPA